MAGVPSLLAARERFQAKEAQAGRLPGLESSDSDDEGQDEDQLVPFEKVIVAFFFAGFAIAVLMLVGLTKLAKTVFLGVSAVALVVAVCAKELPRPPVPIDLHGD